MKHIAYTLIIILFTIYCGCSGSSGKSAAKSGGLQDSTQIVFVKEMHDFGILKNGESVACQFGFSNEGNKPLLIQEVVAGCGCTNVKYPTKPLAPHEKGMIEVTYNSRGKHGHQRQTVNIISNGSTVPVTLVIRANVQ